MEKPQCEVWQLPSSGVRFIAMEKAGVRRNGSCGNSESQRSESQCVQTKHSYCDQRGCGPLHCNLRECEQSEHGGRQVGPPEYDPVSGANSRNADSRRSDLRTAHHRRVDLRTAHHRRVDLRTANAPRAREPSQINTCPGSTKQWHLGCKHPQTRAKVGTRCQPSHRPARKSWHALALLSAGSRKLA